MTTVTRLFDSHADALRAVDALEAAGVDNDRISIISNNADNWHAGHRHDGAGPGGPGDLNKDGENDTAEGAGKGATSGGLIGGAAGLLAGLGMLAIPGLGPVVAVGWLASTAAGALAGAVAGGAAGGLLGALKEAGHTDDEANVYSEGVRRGGTLISVRASEADAARIQQILHQERGVDAGLRGQAYREAGWINFDREAPAFTHDQVLEERRRYQEPRSFAGDGLASADDDLTDSNRSGGVSAPIPGARA